MDEWGLVVVNTFCGYIVSQSKYLKSRRQQINSSIKFHFHFLLHPFSSNLRTLSSNQSSMNLYFSAKINLWFCASNLWGLYDEPTCFYKFLAKLKITQDIFSNRKALKTTYGRQKGYYNEDASQQLNAHPSALSQSGNKCWKFLPGVVQDSKCWWITCHLVKVSTATPLQLCQRVKTPRSISLPARNINKGKVLLGVNCRFMTNIC